ncbi:MAG: hypothetical protein HC913_00745 [Microscillaceae bacterium]|nr:hypothetical protein [Microscillaceae bacterium]
MNFNPLPDAFTLRADLDRSFTKTLYRGADLSTRGVEALFPKAVFVYPGVHLAMEPDQKPGF